MVTTLTITWNAVNDARTCPICKSLHGYTWIFKTGQDGAIPNQLTHPNYGVVWDVVRGSQAHGHQRYNCRCSIIPEFNLSDIHAKIQQMLKALESVADE